MATFNPVQEWLNLKNFFQCRLLCHECRADKDTYMRRALHSERYTLDEFFLECLKPGEVCSWAEYPLSRKIWFGFDWYDFHLFLCLTLKHFCTPKKPQGTLLFLFPSAIKAHYYCCPISTSVTSNGVQCILFILDVTCGSWETLWKPSSLTLRFGDRVKMMKGFWMPGLNLSPGPGKTNGSPLD